LGEQVCLPGLPKARGGYAGGFIVKTKLPAQIKTMTTTLDQPARESVLKAFEPDGSSARLNNLSATDAAAQNDLQRPTARFFLPPDWRYYRPCAVPSPLND
jgi:hypothetical protein